jgi:uncharacterized protein (DUF433 family)
MSLADLGRIGFDSAVMGRKPCIRGLRVTAGIVATGRGEAVLQAAQALAAR